MWNQIFNDKIFRGIVLVVLIVAALVTWGLNHSFAAIIGNNTVESLDQSSFPGRAFSCESVTAGTQDATYTAVAGDNIDTLSWYGDWGATATDLTVIMAIYTVPAGDSVADVLVDSSSVTVNSGTKQWWPVVVNIPLTAGVRYQYVWVAKDSHTYEGRRKSCTDCTEQSTIAGGPFVSPFVGVAGFDISFSGYAFVSNTPAGGGDKVGIRN